MLFRKADVDTIKKNIPTLMRASALAQAAHMSPTSAERLEVRQTILEFIKRRRRIVYGGHALNTILTHVSPENAIYTVEEGSITDIEFYSPTPLHDIVEICTTLHKGAHEYVRGKEAMHHNTFTISVEFVRMCDVTYVPESVYSKMPYMSLDGLHLIDPHFAMIDMLRMLCDPFNSHWRLDRTIDRIDLIQKCFPPISISPPEYHPPEDHPQAEALAGASRALFASRSMSCAAIGRTAISHFLMCCKDDIETDTVEHLRRLNGDTTRFVCVTSTKFTEDVNSLIATIDRSGGIISWVFYYPFMDILDEHCVGSVDDVPFVMVLKSDHTPVPCCECSPVDGMRIASFTQTLLITRSMQLWCTSHDEDVARADRYNSISLLLMTLRNTSQFDDILDESNPMREFELDYIGHPQRPMRVHMGKTDERMGMLRRHKRGGDETAWFSFDPAKDGGGGRKYADFSRKRTFLCIDGSIKEVKYSFKEDTHVTTS